MGGSNSGRSHEPQQCGGAHLPNTLRTPLPPNGGNGESQNIASPMTHHPKKQR